MGGGLFQWHYSMETVVISFIHHGRTNHDWPPTNIRTSNALVFGFITRRLTQQLRLNDVHFQRHESGSQLASPAASCKYSHRPICVKRRPVKIHVNRNVDLSWDLLAHAFGVNAALERLRRSVNSRVWLLRDNWTSLQSVGSNPNKEAGDGHKWTHPPLPSKWLMRDISLH